MKTGQKSPKIPFEDAVESDDFLILKFLFQDYVIVICCFYTNCSTTQLSQTGTQKYFVSRVLSQSINMPCGTHGEQLPE